MVVKALPATTLKDAELAPPAIVTPAGTVAYALLLLSEMEVPPGETALRLTVQVPDPPADRLEGAQLIETSWGAAATRLRL